MLNSDSNWLQLFFLEAHCYFFCWSTPCFCIFVVSKILRVKSSIFTTGAPWQTRNFQEQLQEIAVYQADEALDKAVVEAQIEDLESRLDSRQQQNQDVGTVGNGGAKAWRKVWFHHGFTMVSPWFHQQKRGEDQDVGINVFCWWNHVKPSFLMFVGY